jgi:hypothetical protein
MYARWLIAPLLIVLLASCTTTGSSTSGQSVEQVEQERFKAMVARDVTALDKMLAKELTYGHSTGLVQSKTQFLESIRTQQYRYDNINVKEIDVHMMQGVAVLSGLLGVKVAMAGNPATSFDVRYLDAYVVRDGRWQLVAWQAARVM